MESKLNPHERMTNLMTTLRFETVLYSIKFLDSSDIFFSNRNYRSILAYSEILEQSIDNSRVAHFVNAKVFERMLHI